MSDLQNKSKLSRRNALKIAGLTGATLAFNPAINLGATEAKAAEAKGKIVIIGAGASGISTASRLNILLDNPDITMIDDSTTHLYQPAFSLIASGVCDADYAKMDPANYIPESVKWIKEKAVSIDPDAKKVVTDKGQEVSYDYLVVAAGIDLHYDRIKGLDRSMLGKNGIASVYAYEGACAMFDQIKELSAASKTRKVNALFCETPTPAKCGGAPKKVAFLTHDIVKSSGNYDNLTLTQMMPGGGWFGVKAYAEAIGKLYGEKNMKGEFKHKLVAIDAQKKIATFAVPKLVMDEELGMEVEKAELVEKPYDLIHVVPDQTGAAIVANNPKLANPTGYLKVNIETLQSDQYPSIFGVGDIIATPFGKTGGSVRKQYLVVAQNIVDAMQGKAPSAKYNGYTVCPLITGFGSVMMLEFGYKGKDGSDTLLPSAPLDPTKERWMWWLVKVHMMKPVLYRAMLVGRG